MKLNDPARLLKFKQQCFKTGQYWMDGGNKSYEIPGATHAELTCLWAACCWVLRKLQPQLRFSSRYESFLGRLPGDDKDFVYSFRLLLWKPWPGSEQAAAATAMARYEGKLGITIRL